MTVDGIEIKNVQPHEHTIIEPSKRVTVIQGTSHSGKSSIVRAIKKLIENRPMGREGLLSWFASDKDEISIGMSFEEGTYVYREQTKSDNRYTTSESKKPLRAIRSDVPEEVLAITKMNSVNIQSQHDPYFMLQNTPGEVGRMFNEAVGLEIIDETISQAKKLFNLINAQRAACYKQVEDLENEFSRYKGLDEIKPFIEDIEKAYEHLGILQVSREKLLSYWLDMEVLEGDILLTKEFLKLEDDYKKLHSLASLTNAKIRKRQEIYAHVLEWTMTEARIAVNRKWVDQYEKFIEIRNIAQNMSKLRSDRINLKRVLRYIIDTKNEIQAKTEALSDTRRKIYELLQKTKICPFCYTEIDRDTIDHICERRGIK